MNAYVMLSGVEKRFGSVAAVRDLTLTVPKASFLTLLGPSGCGKSTLLRCIAGLESPDAGEIIVDGETLFSQAMRINVPTHRRRLAMVFQSYALWPHMSVEANVSYPVRASGMARGEAADRVAEALGLVGLTELGRRYPHELSGGQQQRVAVARAIAYDSKLLLLDEPLSNLDQKLRDRSRLQLRQLQQRLGLTVIYVTHSQTEALTMSDRIAVLEDGVVRQVGTPTELYESPANEFVAGFVGTTNLLTARCQDRSDGAQVLMVGETEIPVGSIAAPAEPGSSVRVVIRPEDLRLQPKGKDTRAGPDNCNSESGEVTLSARVVGIEYLGSSVMCEVEASVCSNSLHVVVPKRLYADLQVGSEVAVSIDPKNVHVIQ